MILNIILLIVGFVLLIKGADVFVEGASKVAAMLHIPQIVIGLTIVAFGTSAPEAAVSIASAYKGTAGIAIGNIIGSNIANVLLILGVAGMIGELVVKKNTFFIESPFVIVITIVLLFLGVNGKNINRIDGAILWMFFLVFLYYLYRLTKKGDDSAIDDVPELDQNDRLWKLIIMIVLGIICVVVGSQVTVDAASSIAKEFGVSDRIIGLTIVSIGTSLPELVTSIVAARKNEVDMAVGNAIGSNIFNILMVLGIASASSPLQLIGENVIDIIVLVVFSVVVWIFGATKKKISRTEGIAMICMYLCYSAYIIMR